LLSKRNLVLLSERGYWAKELVGPLETIDAKGRKVDFITPTGQHPVALPPSMDAVHTEPPLGRSVFVDEPSITGRSMSDSYFCGEKVVQVLELGLTRWGW